MARVRIRDKRRLRRRLKRYARRVRVEVAREMTAVMKEIKDTARRLVTVESGQLQGSIDLSPEVVDPDRLGGYVGTNVEYAKVIEFGFTGTVSVSAHKRTMTAGFGPDSAYPMAVTVEAHTRRMDREGVFYLTTAANLAARTYERRIGNAVQRASP
jgi:phage gpG-like protein